MKDGRRCSHNKFLRIDSLIASQTVIFWINSGNKNMKRFRNEIETKRNETNKNCNKKRRKRKRKQSGANVAAHFLPRKRKTLFVNKGWLNPMAKQDAKFHLLLAPCKQTFQVLYFPFQGGMRLWLRTKSWFAIWERGERGGGERGGKKIEGADKTNWQ